MKKIAVLIPDFFWSSIPYDGLTMCIHLRHRFGANVDLLMFKNDIRLNKKFDIGEYRHFRFSPNLFSRQNPILLDDWQDFYKISGNYQLILTQTHIAPKIRLPDVDEYRSQMQCPVLIWDIGGTDILNAGMVWGTYFCVKGNIWEQWLMNRDVSKKKIFVTGSPHYDYYLHSQQIQLPEARPLNEIEFRKKYQMHDGKKILLIAPANPGSHKEQFGQNISALKQAVKLARTFDYHVIVKTYPNDYLFYEKSDPYSGVYHRIFCEGKPQYKYIKSLVDKITIIDSHDHFSALLYSHKMFNMSGSHIAWETFYTPCQSYTMNYKDKPYYAGAEYLSNVVLPDNQVNIHLKKIEHLFTESKRSDKKCDEYISKKFAHENITNVVERIIC